jgi:ribonucleoside-diphosphate reductase alpha chain
MCPNECPGLYDVYGENLKNVHYEKAGKGRKPSKHMSCGRKF